MRPPGLIAPLNCQLEGLSRGWGQKSATEFDTHDSRCGVAFAAVNATPPGSIIEADEPVDNGLPGNRGALGPRSLPYRRRSYLLARGSRRHLIESITARRRQHDYMKRCTGSHGRGGNQRRYPSHFSRN